MVLWQGFVGFFKSIFTKSISVSDALFSKTLTVFCPPLPTEPQLCNSKPCLPSSELGSVEKEFSTEPLTTSFLYTIPHPLPLRIQENQKACANSANEGPRDQSHVEQPGVEATADTPRATCLSCNGSAKSHPLPVTQTSKYLICSPVPAEATSDRSPSVFP